MIDTTLIIDYRPALHHGALISMTISLSASIIGLSLGTLLGIAAKERWFAYPIEAYVSFFRGTPVLIQIMIVFYIFPQLGLSIPPFWAATLAIGLNSAAYISQIIRSGVAAVPIGQIEAAKTLGMTPTQIAWYIVLPQTFRVVLPALGNEMVTLVKDSSLASIIGVMELSKEASLMRTRTFDAVTVLFAVSCLYFFMTMAVSTIVKTIQGKINHVSVP